jgi:hypothetical protein
MAVRRNLPCIGHIEGKIALSADVRYSRSAQASPKAQSRTALNRTTRGEEGRRIRCTPPDVATTTPPRTTQARRGGAGRNYRLDRNQFSLDMRVCR